MPTCSAFFVYRGVLRFMTFNIGANAKSFVISIVDDYVVA